MVCDFPLEMNVHEDKMHRSNHLVIPIWPLPFSDYSVVEFGSQYNTCSSNSTPNSFIRIEGKAPPQCSKSPNTMGLSGSTLHCTELYF